MAKSFPNAAAFRSSLESRLRTIAQQRGTQIQGLRLKLAIERLLARLFNTPNPPWLLKGGYSMELRFRPHARATRDVDLAVNTPIASATLKHRLTETHEQLQSAAELDLHDFFEFVIEPARSEIQAAPGGGGVFGVIAKVDARDFARFHIDIGYDDSVIGVTETLEGDDLLDFAGIAPARVIAIAKEQQFAEKIHAYTIPWTDRTNMRTRDLVDLIVLIERGSMDLALLRQSLIETFQRRNRHPLPQHLSPPPEVWHEEFKKMATDAGVSTTTLQAAFNLLSQFWSANSLAD